MCRSTSRRMVVLWVILCFGGAAFAQNFLGCYKSSSSEPDLPWNVLNRASSPSECIQQCHSRSYMFAGLMNGQECYCGSEYGRNGPSVSCVPCATDSSATGTPVTDSSASCGSHESISVYATGQKGPSVPRRIQVKRIDPSVLKVTWAPPDIPNGNVISYTLHAEVIKTHAYILLQPVENQVQGGASNSTTLRSLQPGTKYNISLIATNEHGNSEPVYVSEWTQIGPPDKPYVPKIISRTDTTVTVELSEGSSENGPVTAYQVVVVRPGIIPPSGDNISYPKYDESTRDGLGYYVTGQFDAADFGRYRRFTVGDGKRIGAYYNAPLKAGDSTPQLGLVVVSQIGNEVKYSYSDLTSGMQRGAQIPESTQTDPTIIGLCVAIAFLGVLLVISILTYFIIRRRHEKNLMTRLPEHQELTLQGPLCEVDNMAYIPEDVPERMNHYQELKNKVWNIPRNFLTIDAVVIRRGRFGTVHMGTVQKDGLPSTVTVHSISDGLLRSSEKRHMLRELDVCIRAGTAKYLAGLVGTCETPDTLYVALEMPPQTLKNRLLAARSGDPFTGDLILLVSVAVATALQYLDNLKIIHTHLCARSVGLCNDRTPKLMGHGIAKYALEDIKYTRWTAAECLNNEKKHFQGVVWAFGVLLWEMLSMGGTPYANLASDDLVEDAVRRGTRLPQLRDIPDPLYEVMLSCWQVDPEERPTFDELVRLDTLSVCPITAITEPYIPELELNC